MVLLSRMFVLHLIIAAQVLVLLLPRSVHTQAIIYSAPVLLIVLGLIGGVLRLRLTALCALTALFVVSLLTASTTGGHPFNVILSVATYSTLLYLAVSFDRIDRYSAVVTMSRALLLLAFVDLGIGLIQLVEHGFPARLPYRDFTPDVFRGPYGLGGPRLVTMIFVPALFLVISRILVEPSYKRYLLPVALLGFAVVAPGSNATILAGLLGSALFILVCTVRWILLQSKRRGVLLVPKPMRARLVVLSAVGILVSGVAFSYLGSVQHVRTSLLRFTEDPLTDPVPNPKALVALQTFTLLPVLEPQQPLIGVGLGNYSSWSQLLLSGYYAERFLSSRAVSDLPVLRSATASSIVLRHISPESYALHGRYYVSSISTQPWFSWQSLYAEIGILGLLVLGVVVARRLKALRLRRYDSPAITAFKLWVGAYACFVLVMGFVDNYFEYPWLMAPFLLSLAIVNSSPSQEERTDQE